MSTRGPALFSAIGKRATDLLNKDYNTDQKINITTYTETGLALNSGLANRGGLSSGDVAAQYKYKNVALDVKADTQSNVSTVLTVTDILPSTKTIASIKLPDYKSGKLEVQCLYEQASFTTAVGLNESPAVDFSATIGTPAIAFGAEASFLTGSRVFSKYNAGVSFTQHDSTASVILADKGDSLRASYLHQLSRLNGGAVVGEVNRKFSTNENTLTVGGSYVVDSETVVKARLNNHGNLGALLQHQLTPKSSLTLSAAFDTKALERNPNLGLALSLKP
ncbi:mitochondrial outer membrane protein porin 2-like [Pyrus ussuriensis x Pyrus communis]|uniref:Mitochondrial outer membrane protein porin 2-like n=1 Tax=Pyrus ussuriensis x Pyrus communis TaxID=2448454 RepID=A0A5N5H0C7_9ROSA|nr:mitochondrial outer membrane protein porin 2-like [Pyrus ussuriensis x Pyrus communis]